MLDLPLVGVTPGAVKEKEEIEMTVNEITKGEIVFRNFFNKHPVSLRQKLIHNANVRLTTCSSCPWS